MSGELKALLDITGKDISEALATTSIGSIIYANRPGDGSAREQAASVQKVLGGWGNIAIDYATKRYRSNLVNWGLLPLTTDEDELDIQIGDYVYIKDILSLMSSSEEAIEVKIIRGDDVFTKTLQLPLLSDKERAVLKAGCLMNFYRDNQ